MQAQGYWIKGGQVIDVTFTSHIDYLCDHPADFGFSRQEVEEAFQRYGESPGEEGSAREQLIRIATTRGWIRVRHFTSPRDYWSIQFDKFEQRRAAVASFINSMISERAITKTDEIELTGFHDGFKRVYSFQEGGVGRFLEEQSGSPDHSEDKGRKREGISSAPPQLRCPRCGSTKTKPVPVQMGFYVQCESCGYFWDSNKE